MELKRKQVLIKKKPPPPPSRPLESIAENKMIVEHVTASTPVKVVKVVFPFFHHQEANKRQHEDTFSNAIWPSMRVHFSFYRYLFAKAFNVYAEIYLF